MKNFIKGDHRIYRRNFYSCEKKAWNIQSCMGFEPLNSRYRCSALPAKRRLPQQTMCSQINATLHHFAYIKSSDVFIIHNSVQLLLMHVINATPRTSSALILANSRFVIKHSAARRIFNSLLGVSSASHAWYILKSSANKWGQFN